jgi:hypothetical protein
MSGNPYLRAAQQRHDDPEVIYETAASDGQTARQLGLLVSALRERHDWKLTKRQRDPLIDALLDAGVAPGWIAARIGCHVETVRRRTRARTATRRPTPQNRMDKRSKRNKTGSRVSLPILGPPRPQTAFVRLGFDATSGVDLTADRQRELLARLGGS